MPLLQYVIDMSNASRISTASIELLNALDSDDLVLTQADSMSEAMAEGQLAANGETVSTLDVINEAIADLEGGKSKKKQNRKQKKKQRK